MCGIVGIFSFNGQAPFREIWADLVNHVAHRGPDEGAWWADGPFFFGHRRLSILDLAGGSQPMATKDGSLVVVFNGEIYNYVELREELRKLGYVFGTKSDTEVLLHGYRAWGTELPRHLMGMFAFAIADRVKNELYLARDRFGEKPLFLRHTPKYMAFSSELRPLATFPDLSRTVDIEALGGYLSLNYVPGTATLLQGIQRLPPASWRLFTLHGERGEAYWIPPDEVDVSREQSLDEAVEEFRHRLDQSVSISLRSDVPVGIFLSGGIDSSLIAESAQRLGNLSRAYVIDFKEETYGEFDAAQKVANKLGLPLDRVILTQDALKDFFQIVQHADDPLADSSALAVWTISRHAARKNKVVLGGDGGDELFGGYLTYQASLLHKKFISPFPLLLRKMIAHLGAHIPTSEGKVSFSYKLRRFLRAIDLPTGLAHLTWNGTWLSEEAAKIVQPEISREIVRRQLAVLASSFGIERECNLRHLQNMDIAEYLPNDILTKTDRMSMAHSLETRAPFLVHPLSEWALARPDWQKIGQKGELKRILRHAAFKVYGKEIAFRPKQGFSLPIHKWIRESLAEVVLDLLSPESLKKVEFIHPVTVQKILKDHFSGRKSYGFELWGLAVLVAWYRIRVMRSPETPLRLPLVERRFNLLH